MQLPFEVGQQTARDFGNYVCVDRLKQPPGVCDKDAVRLASGNLRKACMLRLGRRS